MVCDHPPGSTAPCSAVHAAITDRLRTVALRDRAGTTIEREEERTVRKLLRRALWHARSHTADLARRVGV